jgi:hypothetical protein
MENRAQYHRSRKEMAMYEDTVVTRWQQFARKVTGLWREPVENDFAVIAAVSLEHEKAGLAQPSQPETELPWEDEDGKTARPAPSPRPSSLKRRRPTYNPSGDRSPPALAK